MNISNNPAYAFLFGSDQGTPTISPIEQTTEGMESFARRTRESMDDLLVTEKGYVQSVIFGLDEFTTENVGHALEDAHHLSAHITHASELWDELKQADAEKWPEQEWHITLQKLRIDLVSMFYLHREIEILRVFIPLASAKQRSQRSIPNMTIEGQQDAKNMHKQWRAWADELIRDEPGLKGNKSAIAEKLKLLHGIGQALSTIRKRI
ncbi:MAG: hypothetical protein ACYC42_08865 [Lysobacter sp.]